MSNVVRAGAAYEAVLRDNVTGRVDNIIDALGRLEKAFKGVRDPARDVGRTMDRMGATMVEARKRVERQTSVMKTMRNTFSTATSVISTASQSIGQSLIHIGNQMRNAGLAATAAAASIGAMFTKSIQASANYQAEVTGLQAVFKGTADENLKWAESFSNFMGRSPTETVKSLKTFRAVMSSLNLPVSQLDQMSRTMHTLSVDLAAFADISDQQAITKMMQGLSGSAIDELRKLGLTVSDARVKEFAESIGIATKELTEQHKTVIRYNLIVEQMKNGLGAIGQALRERDSLPNQMKRLRAEVEKTAIQIGQHFTPIAAKLMGILRDLAEMARQIPLERFEQLATVMIGLGVAGVILTGLGIALAALGPPIIAFGTVAASALGIVAALITMVATGPIGILTTAIIAATGAMMALVAFFFFKNFPLQRTLTALGEQLNKIFEDIKMSIDIIAQAIRQGDWQTAWDQVSDVAELAFVRIGGVIYDILYKTIVDAISDALEASEKILLKIQNTIMSSYAIGGGRLSDQIARARAAARLRGVDVGGRPTAIGERQENELIKRQERIDEIQERISKRWKKVMDQPVPFSSRGANIFIPIFEMAGKTAAEEAARATQGISMGGFGAGFARNVGMFGPQMSFVDNQEEQIDLADQQLKAQQNMERILNNMEPLTMGNG